MIKFLSHIEFQYFIGKVKFQIKVSENQSFLWNNFSTNRPNLNFFYLADTNFVSAE